jgi:hypothetical protein
MSSGVGCSPIGIGFVITPDDSLQVGMTTGLAGVPAPSVRKPTVTTPFARQLGRVRPAKMEESAGCLKILRKIMASNSQWAQCSSTSRRILRNETGSDLGGQHCMKYRAEGLLKRWNGPLCSSGPYARHCAQYANAGFRTDGAATPFRAAVRTVPSSRRLPTIARALSTLATAVGTALYRSRLLPLSGLSPHLS